jgi:hypothetical protein
LAFLEKPNGASLDHFQIWSAAEVIADRYKASEFGPHLTPFGSDSGGELFAFDQRSAAGEVSMVAAVSDWLNDSIVIAPSFTHLLTRLKRSTADDSYSLLDRDW